jgi:hypothetical protein
MLSYRIRTGFFLSAFTAGGTFSAAPAANPSPVGPRKPVHHAVAADGRAASASPAPTLVDVVSPAHRDAVAGVVRQPTLTAKAAEDEFPAHPNVYDWLLEHPDRTSTAWQRMNIPCVDIGNLGNGQFRWTDENGSELTWQIVGRFPDGVIWYATGKVKPGALLPMVPVKAVAVLHAPRTPAGEGMATLKPSVRVYLLTDSRAAAAVLRMIGPAAPRMAEQGAEQLLLFFSGVAAHLGRNPDKVETLLGPRK